MCYNCFVSPRKGDTAKDRQGCREIERRALTLGYDINLWKILSVSKTDTQRIKILSTIDSYVEPILDVLEYSPEEFAQRMAAEAEGKRVKKKDSWINPDIREFMENPEAST